MKDFFISYNNQDKQWAEWIAYKLEEAGFTTVIQAWDFRAGGDFVMESAKSGDRHAQDDCRAVRQLPEC